MNNLHNINIERSVLSSILFNPATFEEVAAVISAKDFYLPSHRYMFEAMEACEFLVIIGSSGNVVAMDHFALHVKVLKARFL